MDPSGSATLPLNSPTAFENCIQKASVAEPEPEPVILLYVPVPALVTVPGIKKVSNRGLIHLF
jgi:hypothetical protein